MIVGFIFLQKSPPFVYFTFTYKAFFPKLV